MSEHQPYSVSEQLTDLAKVADMLPQDSTETLMEVVADRQRLMNVEGVFSLDEAFIDMLMENVRAQGAWAGTITIAHLWDELRGANTTQEVEQRLVARHKP